jgi:hypothetical protein
MTQQQPMFENADQFHLYTDADALCNGVLIDVSQTAGVTGTLNPFVLTLAAWKRRVIVPAGVLY